MTSPLKITSSDRIEDVDHHFRVTAGPGSGKTHWLIEHVRHAATIIKASDAVLSDCRDFVYERRRPEIQRRLARLQMWRKSPRSTVSSPET